jgi:allantoin racemase
VPVFDITDSAAALACQLGYRYSVVTTLDRSVPQIKESLRSAGVLERCASIRATGLGVLELERDEYNTRRRLAEEARRAIQEYDAEVICLGCGGMAGFDKELEETLGVPVIDGVVAAVKLAEACYDYGLKTSKVRSFASPRPKKILGWPRSTSS